MRFLPASLPTRRTLALAAVASGLVWAVATAQTANSPVTGPAQAGNVTQAGTVAQAASSDWQDLSPAQRAALAPLAKYWPSINQLQKNKWIELSKNYASLPAPEQAKLHARMADWATLSPQQRAQARQNFAEHQALTDGLTPEQRKAQWQAYQLLSPEEKSKLAANSPKPAPGPAAALRPADPLKNSPPPQFGTAKVLAQQAEPAKSPQQKISIAPHLQKGNSLMPQKATVSSADPSMAPVTGSVAPITSKQ
jgi:Protein of unknown function (DUF3106)